MPHTRRAAGDASVRLHWSAPQWSHLSDRLPQLVCLVLGALIVGDGIGFWRSLSAPVKPAAPPTLQSSAAARALRAPESALATIIAAKVFGAPPEAAATATGSAGAQPLVLTGTIVMQGFVDSGGFAILGASKETTHLFKVGEAIGGSAQLAAVFTDHVDLENHGVRIALALPKPAASLRSKLAKTRLPPVASPEAATQPAEVPAAYASIFRVVNNDGDRFKLEFVPGGYENVGLRSGDRIVSINGVRVSSPETLSELSARGPVQLGVEGDGGYRVVKVDSALLN
jgi:type II secretory pathway component PulC